MSKVQGPMSVKPEPETRDGQNTTRGHQDAETRGRTDGAKPGDTERKQAVVPSEKYRWVKSLWKEMREEFRKPEHGKKQDIFIIPC